MLPEALLAVLKAKRTALQGTCPRDEPSRSLKDTVATATITAECFPERQEFSLATCASSPELEDARLA